LEVDILKLFSRPTNRILKKTSYDKPSLSLIQRDPGEIFRKQADKIFSELGGAAALISPQTAFHSAVLLLAAFEGSERRKDRR
jgi:hypothetical protein